MPDCPCGVSVAIPIMPGVAVPLPALPGVCAPVPCGPPGVDGYSPAATVERNTKGALITITDKDGTTQAQIYDGDVSREEWLYAFPTDTASGAVASFPDGADGLPVAELSVSIAPVQAGSGDPAPDNVRPISGRTGLTVIRASKNMLVTPYADATKTQNGVTFTVQDDGTIRLSGTASGTAIFYVSNSLSYLPDGEYVLSGCPAGGANNTFKLDIQQTAGDFGSGASFTKSGGLGYSRIVIYSGVVTDGFIFKPMIRPAALAEEVYEPYDGTSLSVAWEAEAGTVYAGTLDVTTGTLTVSMALDTFTGAENWTLAGGDSTNTIFRSSLSETTVGYNNGGWMIFNEAAYGYGYVAGKLIARSATQSNDKSFFAIVPTSMSIATTFEEWKSWLTTHPLQACYVLAAPVTYALTPQEVDTLLGVNNIWSDAGETAVTYRADPTKYIDKRLTALQALITETGGS